MKRIELKPIRIFVLLIISLFFNQNTEAQLPTDNMVLVEGGTFQMGSNDKRSDVQPVHTVTVNSFYIGKYEVTVKEYLDFVFETRSNQPVWYDERSDIKTSVSTNYAQFGSGSAETYPILGISWNNAVAYCEWLSKKTSKHFRLPTEAEWEYAARGGRFSNSYEFSGSNDPDEVAWYWNNAENTAHPVGEKKPNELGIFDMSGNVWEWCNDWYNAKYYSLSPQNNPQGDSTGTSKVIRGGSWFSVGDAINTTSRDSYNPSNRFINYGFRVVCDL